MVSCIFDILHRLLSFFLGPLQITCDVELSQPLDEIIGNGFLEVIENVLNACNHLFSKTDMYRKLPDNWYLSVFRIK